jgi:hypothetical protein
MKANFDDHLFETARPPSDFRQSKPCGPEKLFSLSSRSPMVYSMHNIDHSELWASLHGKLGALTHVVLTGMVNNDLNSTLTAKLPLR